MQKDKTLGGNGKFIIPIFIFNLKHQKYEARHSNQYYLYMYMQNRDTLTNHKSTIKRSGLNFKHGTVKTRITTDFVWNKESKTMSTDCGHNL